MRTALALLLLVCTHARAASLDAFEPWLGMWSGTVTSTTPDGRSFEFPMRLEIAPSDDPERLDWTITYGEGESAQRRPYQLLAVDPDAGHYRIDERDSIELDAYLAACTLVSVFEVNDSQIVTTYRFGDDTLEFGIVAYDSEPTATTGGGDAPEVRSYAVTSVQRAVLERD